MRTLALPSLLVIASCATTSPPPAAVEPVFTGPLVGSWRGPIVGTAECPFDVEIFGDGTAELNHVDDASAAAACAFVRVPFTVEGDVVSFGDELTCRQELRRDGGRELLALACAAEPPAPPIANARVFRRIEVEERRGQRAVAGRWSAVAVQGKGKALSIALDEDGQGWIGDEPGRFLARTDGTATIELEIGATIECLYRVTSERLTLRCGDPNGARPRTFASDDGRAPVVLLRGS